MRRSCAARSCAVRSAFAILVAAVLAATPARACAPGGPTDAHVAACLAAVLAPGYPEDTNASSPFHDCDVAAEALSTCGSPAPTLEHAYILLGAAFYHATSGAKGADPEGDRYYDAGIAIAGSLLEAERQGPDPAAHDEAMAPLRYLIQRIR